jgi:hypothetical protein
MKGWHVVDVIEMEQFIVTCWRSDEEDDADTYNVEGHPGRRARTVNHGARHQRSGAPSAAIGGHWCLCGTRSAPLVWTQCRQHSVVAAGGSAASSKSSGASASEEEPAGLAGGSPRPLVVSPPYSVGAVALGGGREAWGVLNAIRVPKPNGKGMERVQWVFKFGEMKIRR